VTTAAVRALIIAVLVVGGVVVIAQFPDSSARVASTGSTTPTQTQTPSAPGGTTSGSESTSTGTQSAPSAQVKGVRLAVYNGTLETGLAAAAADDLTRRYGYKIDDTWILDAQDRPLDQTTLYFVSPEDKIEAEALADSYFKKLDVKFAKLPAEFTVPKGGVQVAVYLGTDYAQTQ